MVLVESSVRELTGLALEQLHALRARRGYLLRNIASALLLLLLAAGAAYFSYNGVASKAELFARDERRRAEILAKIREVEHRQKRRSDENIWY